MQNFNQFQPIPLSLSLSISLFFTLFFFVLPLFLVLLCFLFWGMEGENDDVAGSGGGGATPATARWNPTKEQIAMLERLYREGIRTPSAEQIQQITGRLKAYGHIEGKNVFYWFQNHKARQRQKQKQDNFTYFTRFLHNTNSNTTSSSSSPLFPPPPPPPPHNG